MGHAVDTDLIAGEEGLFTMVPLSPSVNLDPTTTVYRRLSPPVGGSTHGRLILFWPLRQLPLICYGRKAIGYTLNRSTNL